MTAPALRNLAACLLLATASDAAFAQLKVGDQAPSELGRSRAGEPVTVPESPGRVHAVTFWASWCGPCQVELPLLEKLQRYLGPEKLRVVAINIEDRDKFREVIRSMSDWQMTLSNDQYHIAQKSFKGGTIPHLTIIGRDGLVRKVFIGYSESSVKSVVTAVFDAVNE